MPALNTLPPPRRMPVRLAFCSSISAMVGNFVGPPPCWAPGRVQLLFHVASRASAFCSEVISATAAAPPRLSMNADDRCPWLPLVPIGRRMRPNRQAVKQLLAGSDGQKKGEGW